MTKNVLVVDDDKICNFLTVNALKKAGIQGDINVTINGIEALSFLNEAKPFPDLILLDINMPIMDGLEFLKQFQINGFTGRCKIVMYTSSIRHTDKDQAFQYSDVFDFINKPLTYDKLYELIQKI